MISNKKGQEPSLHATIIWRLASDLYGSVNR